jgi:hypothetical protein
MQKLNCLIALVALRGEADRSDRKLNASAEQIGRDQFEGL